MDHTRIRFCPSIASLEDSFSTTTFKVSLKFSSLVTYTSEYTFILEAIDSTK